jgi:hypothetical protein
MGKKSKKHYHQFKQAAVKANTPTAETSYNPLATTSVTTQTSTNTRPISASESKLYNWPVGRELRNVGLVFGLLIVLLIAVTITNAKTSLIKDFGNSISRTLHIDG